MWKVLSDAQIDQAKAEVAELRKKLVLGPKREVLHEHNDCIRIAYQWLDAQYEADGVLTFAYPDPRPIKHLIEQWGGRYVSQSDVEVAAHLHPNKSGLYPEFNLKKHLIEPTLDRLKGIEEAFTHESKRALHNPANYKRPE